MTGTAHKQLLRIVRAIERLRMWLLGKPWFTSVLLPAMPRWLRWGLRRAYLAPVDVADRVLGRRAAGVPPKGRTFTGAVDDFADSGDQLTGALRDVADLTPDSQVLDIGCGVGRLALSMSRLLSAEGGYVGIDIVPDGIAWCNNNVRSPYGNLRFKLADVYNKEYNPNGRVVASAYRFPFEDARFDLAVLVSVFTHMLTDEVDNYLGEIARVLAPGGRCFASYFLMNSESTELMDRSTSRARFKRHDGPSWTISRRVPALGIAFDDEYVLDLYRRHGFAPDPAIYRGRWCGRQGHWPPGTGLEAQDVIVATKQ